MVTGSNFSDGLSATESLGYYDGEETPPWDTWLLAFPDNYQGTPASKDYPIILSWILAPFTALAQEAMYVNACDCMRWAAREMHNYSVLRLLEADSLLGRNSAPKDRPEIEAARVQARLAWEAERDGKPHSLTPILRRLLGD